MSKVYFVNSGSAASDLAIRMAFAHTKNPNVLIMEHGYNGNTQISIDISDYKFNNKKGFGQKSNVLKAPIPDTYLGKHKVNDGTAGKQYAQEAMQVIHDAEKTVGAFITEPIVGCGGQPPLEEGYLQNLSIFKEKTLLHWRCARFWAFHWSGIGQTWNHRTRHRFSFIY